MTDEEEGVCGACLIAEHELENYLRDGNANPRRARNVSLALLKAWGGHAGEEHQDLFAVGTMLLIPHGAPWSWHTAATRLAKLRGSSAGTT